ncbi:MAG TPA: hypothetical protein VM733_11125, partial [Thermoanaerobaculia bacterium]|nr:hypothetical protein [Thermoanaerobaculia bacterium]
VLMDFEPVAVEQHGGFRRSRPEVETYSYIKERPAAGFPALLPLFSFAANGGINALRQPLLLRVSIEEGEYFVANDSLGIYGNGVTLQDAVRSFARDLAYYWDYYRALRDDDVAGEGATLKRRYEELVIP